MNLLITGINGFIGAYLVSSLKKEYAIYGLDIVYPEKEGIIKMYSWDELKFIQNIDAIIHLAGKAHDIKNKSEEQTYFDINTNLTKTIFDYFLLSDAKQFFFFSSVKAVADSFVGNGLTEEVMPKPVGPYGESKRAAEDYINSQFSNFNSQLKKVYIFRPCMIHGPGNKGNLTLLYNMVRKGLPWPLGAFENKRSFLSIDNLAFIVEAFIKQGPESGIYHLADDETVSSNELYKLIALSTGKKERIWNCNKKMIKLVAQMGDVCRFPLNSDRLKKLTESYIVSNKKMKQALGISKLPTSAVEGFEKTLKSFL